MKLTLLKSVSRISGVEFFFFGRKKLNIISPLFFEFLIINTLVDVEWKALIFNCVLRFLSSARIFYDNFEKCVSLAIVWNFPFLECKTPMLFAYPSPYRLSIAYNEISISTVHVHILVITVNHRNAFIKKWNLSCWNIWRSFHLENKEKRRKKKKRKICVKLEEKYYRRS